MSEELPDPRNGRDGPSLLAQSVTGVYTAAASGVVRFGSWWLRRSGQWPEEGLRERWARDLPDPPAARPIWIHAASMGEVRVGGLFGAELLERGQAVVASAMTEPGYNLAQQVFPANAPTFRVPFDLPGPLQRVIRHFDPRAIVLIETEWWPNLLIEASKAGVPVYVVNGRLSEKAYRRYRLGRAYWRHLLGAVDFFYMRSEDDAKRLHDLGIDRRRMRAMGTLKSVAEEEGATAGPQLDLLCRGNAPIWIAGCTRPGEEEIVLESYDIIRRQHPNLRLWIAPRHPQRFDDVAEILQRTGRAFIRWNELNEESSPADVLLVDRLGVLAGLYRHADVAFIGGSLLPYGGHNPLEPALAGIPVTFGQYMDQQRDAAEFLLGTGQASEVWGAESLAIAISEYLREPVDPATRQERAALLRARLEDVRRQVADALLARLNVYAPVATRHAVSSES